MKRMLQASPHVQVRHSTQFALIYIGGILLASLLMTFTQIQQAKQDKAALSQVEVVSP